MTRDEALKILGLDGGSDAVQIKAAYRKLALRHHPDKGGNAESFIRIKQAYEILTGRVRTPARINRGWPPVVWVNVSTTGTWSSTIDIDTDTF